MGKKKRKEQPAGAKVDTSDNCPLSHNPFALFAQSESLQSVPTKDETVEEASEPTAAASATGATPRATSPSKVVIRHERKGRSGKTVTIIEGLPASQLDEWARRLKRALGCGATIEGDTLVLLGSLRERAAEYFEKTGVKGVVRGT